MIGMRAPWLAVVAVSASQVSVSGSWTTSVIVFIACSGLWLRHELLRDRLFQGILTGGVLCILGGLFLTRMQQSDHYVDRAAQQVTLWSSISLVCLALVIAMAARRASPESALIGFAIGHMTSAVLGGVSPGNPWKFDFALPISILLVVGLSTLAAPGKGGTRLSILGLITIAGISVLNDYRSLAGMCVLSSLLIYMASSPTKRLIPSSRAKLGYLSILIFGVWLIVKLGTEAALAGYLGDDIQSRSEMQVRASGSLITGGRPEWFATVQLMQRNPWGYGFGVLANSRELPYAFNALAKLGIGSDNRYVQVYMFGSAVELHSVAADMWARFGLIGLACALLIFVLLVSSLIDGLTRKSLEPIDCLLIIWSIWSLLFGPIYTDAPLILATLSTCVRQIASRSRCTEKPVAVTDSFGQGGKTAGV